MLIEELGFDGVYVSGATLANDLGLPDIGLTTLTEVSERSERIARVTGFGEPMNIARAIAAFEQSGVAGVHIEDQVSPKRCGHLDGKQLVPRSEMERKLQAAAAAKTDPAFLLIARSDARAIEGLDATIERAKAYVQAGAEAFFPEALVDEREYEAVRRSIEVPILANMTEFGKSKLLDAGTLASLGINIVIYPATAQRLAMRAIEVGLTSLRDAGTQASMLGQMQTRERLYQLLRYADYALFDDDVYNFNLPGGTVGNEGPAKESSKSSH
jgi:methylisocitrate lyase